ncbi:MAG TPA: Uma2 family endonuclease [Spirochaetota bacterium]|mgnify:FL=1|nr:Uma2 family endonuclease [Spirochaetota bacterium]HNT10957.1 Uma2 family endonuclease [Spirochaetota bacterium]HOS40944.1 Uma2 family endonuclease [Spirochaetota bacterium]
MALPKSKADEKFTYTDYCAWPHDEHWELIDGVAYDMSPSPGTGHQEIVLTIARIIAEYLDGKQCKVFVSPLDVRLPESTDAAVDEDIVTVVQPDVVVVCDPRKIDTRGILGAPDLAVEVLSESTAYKDETQKLLLYERHGVREYWIVNPGAGHLNLFRIGQDGRYEKPLHYRANETFESIVLPGLILDCGRIFSGIE